MKEKRQFNKEELYDKNAFQVLFEYALDHLNDPAIIYRADLNVEDVNKKVIKKTITYKELIDNIVNTYQNLKKNGVQKWDTVIFSSITTPELIYTCYACIMMGAIFKAIDVRFSEDEILDSFEQTPGKIFFCMEPIVGKVNNISSDLGVDKIVTLSLQESLPNLVKATSKILSLKDGFHLNKGLKDKRFITWDKFNEKNPQMLIPIQPSKDEIINITTTTGTTGKPKPIMYDSANWNAQFFSGNKTLPMYMKDKLFNCTVPWVSFGLPVAVHMFLCSGITLEMDPLWTPEKNAYYIRKNDPSWWLGAPGWLDDLFTNEEFENTHLKNTEMFVCGGAPLFREKHELYQNKLNKMNEENSHHGIIAPGYGLSEATASISCNKDAYPYGTNGTVFPSFKVKITDPETNEEKEDGQIGHLLVKAEDENLSPIFKGYIGVDSSDSFTEDGWLKTGDLTSIIGYKDNSSQLGEITRMKNILTYNGYNIDCDKIKEEILKLHCVDEVEVIEAHTTDGNQVPLICVTKKMYMEDKIIKTLINDILVSHLPSYYEYAGIEILDSLPKKSMKIDIKKLQQMFLDKDLIYTKNKGKILIK